MQYFYTFIISFIFIFLSEIGDKTQILVLSFSTQNKTSHILIGIALGTLLSHGLAILLGSNIASLGNDNFIFYLKIATYITFLLFGIFGFIKQHSIQTSSESEKNIKSKITDFIHSILRNCILLVAISIALGEIGDKTWLASIGLGIQYPQNKISLIIGSICGMLSSDSLAIFFGKWLGNKISDKAINILSNLIFIIFGIIGLLSI